MHWHHQSIGICMGESYRMQSTQCSESVLGDCAQQRSPSFLPSAPHSGSARRLQKRSGSAHVSTTRTFSSPVTYSCGRDNSDGSQQHRHGPSARMLCVGNAFVRC